jgi:hypothetical protein
MFIFLVFHVSESVCDFLGFLKKGKYHFIKSIMEIPVSCVE